MITDALKKFREIFAYVLLVVAALYVISGLSLLLKSKDDIGGLGFSGKAATFGYLFTHPVVIFCLIAAVALVVGFGAVTKHARIVVLVALAIAGIALLLALVSWFSSFGADDNFGSGPFGGVLGAGKIVGILLGLAHLLLLGLTAWFAFTVFKALPKSAPQSATSWGQPQGYGAAPGYGQPTWGQQDTGYRQQQGWGQPQQGWPGGQTAGATAVGATAAGWGDSSQGQPDHQGQPASAWGAASAPQPSPGEGQPGWGSPGQPQQWATGDPAAGQWRQSEGTPAPAGGQEWGSAEAGSPRPSQGSTAAESGEASQWERPGAEPDRPSAPEGEQPQQRSGWWQGPAQ